MSRDKHEREIVIAKLEDFEIYKCPTSEKFGPYELTCLHFFDVKAKNLCFDGHVRVKDKSYYVERISIHDISIEGYGSNSNPEIVTYLQTSLASKDKTCDIWLQLEQPASGYARLHSDFLWVATFGIHVIDYMAEQPESTVGLRQLRNDFHTWLVPRFGSNTNFLEWFAAFNHNADFRAAFHAYVTFIYNQAANLPTSEQLISHPIWSECMCKRMKAIPSQPSVVKDTIVTPHVYECFRGSFFAEKLKKVALSPAVAYAQRKRKIELGFVEDCITTTQPERRNKTPIGRRDVRKGDVVSIAPDDHDKVHWRNSGEHWLAYIQDIEHTMNGAERLIVLWIYYPKDTLINQAKYPIANEVFLSDHCNCGDRDILSTDVIRKHTVAWSPKSMSTSKDFIISKTYLTRPAAFDTLHNEHKVCACRSKRDNQFEWHVGDTVYATKSTRGMVVLEPIVIDSIDHASKTAEVRTLLRLARDCSDLLPKERRGEITPNELVLTSKIRIIPVSRIQRRCHVRFVPRSEVRRRQVPAPFNENGTGDYWFISMSISYANDGSRRLVPLEKAPEGLREYLDAPCLSDKLQGLSVFSGGGGLDRGLEQGGAVEFRTVIDYDAAAIHTQAANCSDPQNTRFYFGSVDDYLSSLLRGDMNRLVARVGEVDLIAAGTPCPGSFVPTDL